MNASGTATTVDQGDISPMLPPVAVANGPGELLTEHMQRAAFQTLLQVVDITSEIFGDDVRIKSAVSPDFSSERYVCLTAETNGDNASILAKEAEWAGRIATVKPVWDGFKLRVKRKTRIASVSCSQDSGGR